jgi:hypothetical protein
MIDMDDITKLIGRLYLESQMAVDRLSQENRELKAELAKITEEERGKKKAS